MLAALPPSAEWIRAARVGKPAGQPRRDAQSRADCAHRGGQRIGLSRSPSATAVWRSRPDWSPGEPLLHAQVDRQAIAVQIDAVGSGWRLIHEGGQAEALVLTPRQAELYALMPVKAAPDTSKFLLSPMPGLLASVAVSEGQEIKTGEVLAVVEAMKMENVLRADARRHGQDLARQGRRQPARRPEDHRVRLSRRWRCRPASPSRPGAGRRLSRLGDRRPRRLGLTGWVRNRTRRLRSRR